MRKNFTLIVVFLFALFLSVTDKASAQINCTTPANLTAANISPTGAVLTLGTTATAGAYNIRYHGPNSTTWITLNNVTIPYQLGNLTCHTAYEWQAQQVCGTTPNGVPYLSDWSTGAAFATTDCPVNSCPTPTYLSTTNISQTGAVLNLGTIANTGTFNIRYHGPNSTTWITMNNVTMPFQLGNLMCNTTYEWQAQKVCAETSGTTPFLSAWSTGVAFTTAVCPAPTCPTPVNLTTTNISANGAVLYAGTASNTGGTYNIRYHGPNSINWIVLNNITMPFQLGNLSCHTGYEWQAQQVCAQTPGAVPVLSAWSTGAAFTTANCPADTCPTPTYLSTTNISQTGAVLNLGTIANTGTFNIRYHGPNSTNWIVLNNITMPFQLGNLSCHTGYEWQAQKVCATSADGTAALSPWSAGIAFTTNECPVNICPVPTNLTATNIHQTGAVLNLGSSTTDGIYNIRYHGPNSTTWVMLNNVTMPFQLGNLTCHTTYEWQAQKVCANSAGTTNAFSSWSVGSAFTTNECPVNICPVPTNLTATNIHQTGAVLNLGSGTTDGIYNIRYHGPNSTTWVMLNNVTMPFQLGNLTCHTTYEWQAQKVCANSAGTTNAFSSWSVGSAFTTTECPVNTCPMPTNLTASNIHQTGVVLNLGSGTTDGTYNIRYHGPNSTTWIILNNVTMPFQLGNLACHTTYEWQAQRVCPSSSNTTPVLSLWSAGASFTTIECPVDTCSAPTYLSTANISQTGAVLNLGTIANSGTFNIRYHGPNSTTWIILNNVTMPYQLGNLACHTTYEWQAQKVCATSPDGTAALSPWSAGIAFTTTECPVNTCLVPANLTESNIHQTGAVLNFGTTATTGVYNIRYHGANSTTWIMLNNVTMPFQLGNLACHTTYEWQAQRVCANSAGTTNAFSPWSAGASFTTTECPVNTCPTPTNLTASNIHQTGAVLNLGATTTDGTYNIRYHGPNSTTWIMLNNVVMPFQLGNLACRTTYEWQAQRVCHAAPNTIPVLSPWSTGSAFTTTECPVNTCPTPTYLSTTNISQTGAVLNLGTIANPGTFNIRYHGPNSATWITLNNVTMPFQLRNLMCHTTYEWQAQKVCATAADGTTALSTWSTGVAFTTADCRDTTCPMPINLTATNISTTGAVLHWNGVTGVASYVVRFKPANSTLSFRTVTATTNVVQVIGLTAGTTYIWQVAAVCPNGTTMASWSAQSMFSTSSSLTAYPNPANQNTSVSYWSDRVATVNVKVMDLYGKEIITQKREAVQGTNVFGIDTRGISDGLYMIGVYTESGLTTTKVIIKH